MPPDPRIQNGEVVFRPLNMILESIFVEEVEQFCKSLGQSLGSSGHAFSKTTSLQLPGLGLMRTEAMRLSQCPTIADDAQFSRSATDQLLVTECGDAFLPGVIHNKKTAAA